MGTRVSMELATAMLGFSRTNRTTARVSGSDRGNAPAPFWVQPRPVCSRPGMGRQFST